MQVLIVHRWVLRVAVPKLYCYMTCLICKYIEAFLGSVLQEKMTFHTMHIIKTVIGFPDLSNHNNKN